jgi:hypothetical protein
VKPTLRDVAVLTALQLGCAAVMSAVMSLFLTTGGSNGWIGGLGLMIGAQSFVMLEWRKRPGRVSAPGFTHRLSLWAVVAQLAVTAVFVGVLAIWSSETVVEFASGLGWGWAIVVAVAAPLIYLMTRAGLSMGLKNLARAQAAEASKKIPE